MPGVMQDVATHPLDWLVILPVVLSLIGAALLLMLREAREAQYWLALALVAVVLATDLALVLRVSEIGPVSMTMGRWLPPFGISFTADIASAVFALAAAGVTLAVLVYLRHDMPDRARRDGAYPLVLLLLAGVSGAFLTGDLFNLYVWFEVMLISSFGLMVLGGRSIQLDGAVKYGFLNFLATTIFLLALGLLYGTLGTLNMADIIARAAQAEPAVMASIAALLLLAFGMKAAAFPVNAWLPASYHAPPAAISALMAGLLTKVGVYALLRVLAMLLPASREVLDPILMAVAVATLILGPLGAIAETNLRRALGFLVIGGIGASLAGLAIGDEAGLAGAATYVLHAMLTITALYLLAGLIETITGEMDTRRMGGLYAAASLPSALFFVLMLAVSGVPPFLGFWPKLLLVEGGIEAWRAGAGGWALAAWIAVLANALLTLIAGSRLWAHIFWRPGHEDATTEAPNADLKRLDRAGLWLGLGSTGVLTAAVLLLGLWPEPLLGFGKAAAAALLHPADYIAATGLEGAAP
ncbi:MAG: Na+/H+ antiporter subunit D [Devosia sp.]|uniref:proton-conducting transporter transmembrane domain-containing protein n=1 Tax=Devosia sp. TaxID=1871048 RepID=UPI001AC538C2|nr:proton-conducting transporter membrane subunit [Devosia sp.]MBN9317353.1 Na+/H+ antiporter subunit D [Devosia sp.]